MTKGLKKGFTIVELVVVIAVLGILVLLASGSFLGEAERARIAHIKNDVKSFENEIDNRLAYDNNFVEDWNQGFISVNELYEKKNSGDIYDKRGRINENYSFEDEYILIPENYIDSKLPGDFIINSEFKVYYVDEAGEKENSSHMDCSEAEAQGYTCIYTIEELAAIDDNGDDDTGYFGGKYMLMNDLDFKDYGNFNPLGMSEGGYTEYYFIGEFHGNNYSMNNLTIGYPEGTDYALGEIGLFGVLDHEDALVHKTTFNNLKVQIDSPENGEDFAWAIGGVVGAAYLGSVKDITVNGFSYDANVENGYMDETESISAVVGFAWDLVAENITVKNMKLNNMDHGIYAAGSVVGMQTGDIIMKNIYVEGFELTAEDILDDGVAYNHPSDQYSMYSGPAAGEIDLMCGIVENITVKNSKLTIHSGAGGVIGGIITREHCEEKNPIVRNIQAVDNITLESEGDNGGFLSYISLRNNGPSKLTIENVNTKAKIIGDYNNGGFVGFIDSWNNTAKNMILKDLKVETEISTGAAFEKFNQSSGGLIGEFDAYDSKIDLEIENVSISGSVEGQMEIGGIIGLYKGNWNNSSTLKMNNVVSSVDLQNKSLTESSYGVAGLIGTYGSTNTNNNTFNFKDVHYNGQIKNLDRLSPELAIHPLIYIGEEHSTYEQNFENVTWDKSKNPELIPYEQ